tara:strand:+ start:6764 stop:6883 length:120 start_codon:yes stop_codon:yes gene_type:complete
MKAQEPVPILESHWEPFVARAAKYGVDVEELRAKWKAQQ